MIRSMLRGAVAAGLAALVALALFTGQGVQPRADAAGPAPLSLHPKNRHYFLFRGKPAILVGSGVYGAVVHRDFDYLVYLNELRRLGLNQTRLFTGSYVARSSSGGEQYADSLVPRDRLLAPWARSDTPGYALGGNKFDLERWDPEYFTRLRHFVAEAGKRGVVVEVVFFSANYGDWNWSASPLHADNNVNGVGRVAANEAYRLDGDAGLLRAQERLVEKIVRELNDFDNVYYEPLNEPYHASCPDGVDFCAAPRQWEEQHHRHRRPHRPLARAAAPHRPQCRERRLRDRRRAPGRLDPQLPLREAAGGSRQLPAGTGDRPRRDRLPRPDRPPLPHRGLGVPARRRQRLLEPRLELHGGGRGRDAPLAPGLPLRRRRSTSPQPARVPQALPRVVRPGAATPGTLGDQARHPAGNDGSRPRAGAAASTRSTSAAAADRRG